MGRMDDLGLKVRVCWLLATESDECQPPKYSFFVVVAASNVYTVDDSKKDAFLSLLQ